MHTLFGVLSILSGVVGYSFYFASIFRGHTKPHVFTWLTYGIIDAIVVAAQIIQGAGAGSWALLFSVTVCFIIAALSLRLGEKHITTSDWACFFGALVAIGVWAGTKDPLGAVVLATLINVLGMVPTFRKSLAHPYEEALSMWSLDVLKYVFSLLALESVSLTTALFPAGIVLTNGAFVVTILLNRRRLGTVSRT